MNSTVSASAPAKVILFGEHTVVYGQPAIAAPIPSLKATVTVTTSNSGRIHLTAHQLGVNAPLEVLPPQNPIRQMVEILSRSLAMKQVPPYAIQFESEIPVSSGMGSGAALSVAMIRAMARYLQQPITVEEISDLAFEMEKIHHGTPSGIDNTVIAYESPIFFQHGSPVRFIHPGATLHLVIAGTGSRSNTKEIVADVRTNWTKEPARFNGYFSEAGRIAEQALLALESGRVKDIGDLLNENQSVLKKIGVSSDELNILCKAALQAGALGAKLSGAGRGGIMIALVNSDSEVSVMDALTSCGAKFVFNTTISTDTRQPTC